MDSDEEMGTLCRDKENLDLKSPVENTMLHYIINKPRKSKVQGVQDMDISDDPKIGVPPEIKPSCGFQG